MITDPLVDFYERNPLPICVDTRKLAAGDLFFALKGAHLDGHHFVQAALAKGAKAAVVDYSYYNQLSSQSQALQSMLMPVPEPLVALQQLARRKMTQFSGKVIAVTGSVGKTTTKEFIVQLLATKFKVAATLGNYNSKIGLPISLLNHVPSDAEILVAEMGMSQAGEIAQLVSIAPPDIAILTAVALAHAENFSSLAAIAKAKAEIFSHAKTSLAIINKLICGYAEIMSSLACSTLSFAPDGYAADYSFSVEEQLCIFYRQKLVATFPKPPLLGVHNYQNLLAAIVVAFTLGLEPNAIADSIKNCFLPDKRLQIKVKKAITFIDDSYNATCLSMKAALDALSELPGSGQKIAVLGEMKELGSFAMECHQQVAMHAIQKADVVIFIGQAFDLVKDVCQLADQKCYFASHSAMALQLLGEKAMPGDTVLLKGSNLANLSLLYDKF